MAQLPHVLKRIRLNLARSKDFPSGSERHGYDSSLRSTPMDTSIPSCGADIASIAG